MNFDLDLKELQHPFEIIINFPIKVSQFILENFRLLEVTFLTIKFQIPKEFILFILRMSLEELNNRLHGLSVSFF